MRKVYPYHFVLGENGSITQASSMKVEVYGKSFLSLRNLYLSGSDPYMFSDTTLHDPFSSNNLKMRTAYPSFNASIIPQFLVHSDNIINFTFTEVPRVTGYIDIIAENEAGYGKLSVDSVMPFLSSFQGAVNIQNPWVRGIIIDISDDLLYGILLESGNYLLDELGKIIIVD